MKKTVSMFLALVMLFGIAALSASADGLVVDTSKKPTTT